MNNEDLKKKIDDIDLKIAKEDEKIKVIKKSIWINIFQIWCLVSFIISFFAGIYTKEILYTNLMISNGFAYYISESWEHVERTK